MNARELDSIARHQSTRIGRLREALAIISAIVKDLCVSKNNAEHIVEVIRARGDA